jgi:hypothetical protein
MTMLQLLELLQIPYCERAGVGLLAEPLNAISNLAFAIRFVMLSEAAENRPSRGNALFGR